MKNVIKVLLFSFLGLCLFLSCSKDQALLSPNTASSNDNITYWDNGSYCLVLDEASLYATLYARYTNSTYGKYISTIGSAKYSLSGDRILFTPILYLGDPTHYGYLGPTESAQFDETKSYIMINIDIYNCILYRSVIPPSGLN